MSNVPEVHASPDDGHGDQTNFYDTQQLRALSDGQTQTDLLVLSRDPTVIDVVRTAAPRIVRVMDAPNLDTASEIPSLQPGVLVVDMTVAPDLAAMLPQLTQHFPEVVIVVAGKRDNVAALMRLTAGGRIFRFLLIPLGHGQTRLALGAALAQHLGMKAANLRTGEMAASTPTTPKFPVAYVALGVGALVVIAGIWLTVRSLTEKPAVPANTVVVQPASPTDRPDPVKAGLALAKEAFAEGKYLEPRGDSALDLYRNVVSLDPANDEAQAGIRAIVDKILEGAEQALTQERLAEAIRGLDTARGIDATHPRLAFLDLQVARERERLALDQARDKANRVRKLVDQATAHMKQQRLLRPPGSNARDTLQEARRLDPTDPGVELASRELGVAMTEAARRALAAGDLAQAQELVEGARKLGSPTPALAEVERAVADASRRAPVPVGVAVANNSANVDARSSLSTADGRVARSPEAPVERRDGRAPEVAPPPPAVVVAPVTGPVAQQGPSDAVLQAADLVRKREVAPDYPSQAALDGTEGWVDIDFTISPEGVPQDLKVRDAKPKRVFDRAAINSVRQWRFEPIVENGTPVVKRATLRVRFQRQ